MVKRFKGPRPGTLVEIDAWGKAHIVPDPNAKPGDATSGDKTDNEMDTDMEDAQGNGIDRGTKRKAGEAGINDSSMEGESQVVTKSGGALTAGGGGSASGHKETGVDPYPRIQRNFFSETCTASLPLTLYFSMNVLDKTSPVVLKINLNSPYQVLTGNVLEYQEINTAKRKGLSNCLSKEISSSNWSTLTESTQFAHTVEGPVAKTATRTSSGTLVDTSAVPARRAVYDKIYESYHTIETRWRIQAEHGANEGNAHSVVFMDYDAFTGSSTGNVIPDNAKLLHYFKWPRVQTHRLGPRYLAGQSETTWKKEWSGVWRPGDILKNTKNEEDIKTWYSTTTGAPSPAWVESLVLLAFADTFGQSHPEQCINLQVDLEYIVQYKDLKRFMRYPTIGDGTTQVMNIPNDIFQKPFNVETVP